MSTTKLILANNWQKDKSKCQDLNFCKIISEIAKDELREDESTKRQCLRQMRDWIKHNQDVENVLTDDGFLLRFLRAKKFSVPMAQQTLLKYLNLRKRFKHIFQDLDCTDRNVDALITSGYIFASPFRDRNGRRVVIHLAKFMNPARFSSHDVARAHIITYETLLDDEENQILGNTYFADAAGFGVQHIAMWNINELATIMKWGEQSVPIRHKSLHLINLHKGLQYVVDFASGRVSEKLRKRIFMYSSVSSLDSGLDPHVLPKEYGGTMPMQEMISLWKKEMLAKRERLLSYDAMNLLSDRSIITRQKNPPGNIEELQGSFRKLEFD